MTEPVVSEAKLRYLDFLSRGGRRTACGTTGMWRR